ncbi:MAG: AP2 domain-containing protein [Oscillospiraceae bacterium]|nr:AP2 domain-containing protein [Oscillospiraceae bacterium]
MKQKMNDITGRKFGNLTAVKPTDRRCRKAVVWECKCDCGQITYESVVHLLKGNQLSCGCLPLGNYKDLTGKRFGRLVALKATSERIRNSVVWECLCDCGKTVKVSSSHLKQGATNSCGCLKKWVNSKDITGQRYGKLTAVKPTEKRAGTNVVWQCICDCGKTVYTNTGALKAGDVVSCGCLKRKKKNINSSGVTGVSLSKKHSKWKALIYVNHKNYYLGQYGTLEEASKVRKIAEEKHNESFLEWYKNFKIEYYLGHQ